MALSQMEMVLRGKPNLRFKFHTMIDGKQIGDNVLVGEIKMEVEQRSVRIFFLISGFLTHVVATTVCATGGVHTLRVARTFL